jgi:hypothetical protein
VIPLRPDDDDDDDDEDPLLLVLLVLPLPPPPPQRFTPFRQSNVIRTAMRFLHIKFQQTDFDTTSRRYSCRNCHSGAAAGACCLLPSTTLCASSTTVSMIAGAGPGWCKPFSRHRRLEREVSGLCHCPWPYRCGRYSAWRYP